MAAAAIIASGAGSVFSTIVSGLLTPLHRQAVYLANELARDCEVVPEQAVFLYHRGRVDWSDLTYLLGNHGIEHRWRDEPGEDSLSRWAWREWIARTRPRMSIDTAHDMWLHGKLSEEQFAEHMDFHGLRDGDDRRALLASRNSVSVAQARAEWQAERITLDQRDAEYAFAGFGAPGDVARASWHTQIPGVAATMALHWRQRLTVDQRNEYLDYAGATSNRLLNEYIVAATPVPGPADLVRFAVREAWDVGVVNRWGYDAEFPRELDVWLTAQGLGQPEVLRDIEGNPVFTPPWAKMYWRAHWQPMAPHQAAEAFNRISGPSLERLRERFPGIQEFTQQHFSDVLKIADYPPAVRDWLMALSVPRMDKRDVRQLYISGRRDARWAADRLFEFGHTNSAVLDILARWDYDREHADSEVQREVEKATAKAIIKEIEEGYADGWLSRAEATSRLSAHALPADVISDMLDVVDGKKAREYLRDFVKRVKADYLGGVMTPQEVLVRLLGAAIVPDEAQRLLQRWTLLATTKRRALASGQIIALAKQGILTPQAAALRLANLGWVQGDIALQVLSIQRQVSLAAQRAAQAQGRARVAARKSLSQSAKQAGTIRRQAIAQLRSMYPKAELRRWLKEGIVNGAYVAARLREQQRSPDYIDKFLRDAGYVKPPKAGKAAAPEAPPPA